MAPIRLVVFDNTLQNNGDVNLLKEAIMRAGSERGREAGENFVHAQLAMMKHLAI